VPSVVILVDTLTPTRQDWRALESTDEFSARVAADEIVRGYDG